jgi:hypothetical protein
VLPMLHAWEGFPFHCAVACQRVRDHHPGHRPTRTSWYGTLHAAECTEQLGGRVSG